MFWPGVCAQVVAQIIFQVWQLGSSASFFHKPSFLPLVRAPPPPGELPMHDWEVPKILARANHAPARIGITLACSY